MVRRAVAERLHAAEIPAPKQRNVLPYSALSSPPTCTALVPNAAAARDRVPTRSRQQVR